MSLRHEDLHLAAVRMNSTVAQRKGYSHWCVQHANFRTVAQEGEGQVKAAGMEVERGLTWHLCDGHWKQ